MSDATTQKNLSTSLGAGSAFTIGRRKVLKGLFGFLGVVGLGNILYALCRFWAPGSGEQAAVEIGIGEIPEGGTLAFQFGGTPGIIFRAEGDSFRALSLVCTHLACTVSWNPGKKEFYCPCHEGFFDAEGKVASGPPPAPLERWKVEIRGDKVIIGM
jgi:cytochrome b6-f complex iron-sulfur subunit